MIIIKVLHKMEDLGSKQNCGNIYEYSLKSKFLYSTHELIRIIIQTKGKQNRNSMLSKKILLLLRQYYLKYKPKEYLFEGSKRNKYYKRVL